MNILAVDTSTVVASVAVMQDKNIICEYSLNHKKTHSQKLIPMIHEVLRNSEIKPKDIDLFAVSVGPGSFTGLRIGVTSIKAMAYALGKPAKGINTLDTLAFNIPFTDALISPIIDARNNQVYNALYQWNKDKQERLTDYVGIDIGELIKEIKKKGKQVFVLGDGVNIHKERLINELGNKCLFPPVNLLYQRASCVAEIAMGQLSDIVTSESSEIGTDDINSLVPFYLRKSQAERLYDCGVKANSKAPR